MKNNRKANDTKRERRNVNLWEDEAAKAAVVATGRRTLVVAGLLKSLLKYWDGSRVEAEGRMARSEGGASPQRAVIERTGSGCKS